MDSNTEMIIGFTKKNRKITRKDVEKLCGVKATKAGKLLKGLVDCGALVRVGKGKETSYILPSNIN